MVDEFIITIVRILLGDGIKIFHQGLKDKNLKFIGVKNTIQDLHNCIT